MKQIQYEATPQGLKIPLKNQTTLLIDGQVTHCLRRVGTDYVLTTNVEKYTAYEPDAYPDKMIYSRVDIVELHRIKSNIKQTVINHQLAQNAIGTGYSDVGYLLQQLNNEALVNDIIINLDGTYHCVRPNFFNLDCFLKKASPSNGK